MFGHSSTSQIWSRYGTVLTGDPTNDETNAQEPSVIYESGAHILTGTASVYKMWWKGGWDTPHLNYSESVDGISWTNYGNNPVKITTEHPYVFKDGSAYYLYSNTPATGTQFDLYTSSDGLSWTLDTLAVLSVGAGGAWDNTELGNIFVWTEGASDWRAIYEARTNNAIWKLGYATSSDGRTWSKSGSNPVISETGMVGGPFVYKNGTNDYWLWAHASRTSNFPTDIVRYKSSNLTTWAKDPAGNCTLMRTAESGIGAANGQIADITLLSVGSQTYAWASGNPDGSSANGHAFINLYIARLPMTQLIHTNEGF